MTSRDPGWQISVHRPFATPYPSRTDSIRACCPSFKRHCLRVTHSHAGDGNARRARCSTSCMPLIVERCARALQEPRQVAWVSTPQEAVYTRLLQGCAPHARVSQESHVAGESMSERESSQGCGGTYRDGTDEHSVSQKALVVGDRACHVRAAHTHCE
jgi:hypothetical protein